MIRPLIYGHRTGHVGGAYVTRAGVMSYWFKVHDVEVVYGNKAVGLGLQMEMFINTLQHSSHVRTCCHVHVVETARLATELGSNKPACPYLRKPQSTESFLFLFALSQTSRGFSVYSRACYPTLIVL